MLSGLQDLTYSTSAKSDSGLFSQDHKIFKQKTLFYQLFYFGLVTQTISSLSNITVGCRRKKKQSNFRKGTKVKTKKTVCVYIRLKKRKQYSSEMSLGAGNSSYYLYAPPIQSHIQFHSSKPRETDRVPKKWPLSCFCQQTHSPIHPQLKFSLQVT